MATANTARRILDAIKSAPHSVSQAAIARTLGDSVSTTDISNVVNQLELLGYIKQNRNEPYSYFTRTPKREVIQGFIAGANDLPGMTFTEEAPAARPFTPGEIRENEAHRILRVVRNAQHACEVGLALPSTWGMIVEMLEAGLIKEHRDQPGHYFTRRPYRDDIDMFLNNEITLDELFDITTEVPEDLGDHTDHTDSPAVSVTASMDAFLDQLEQIREQLNALLDANGR